MQKPLTLGIAGLGTVGAGLLHLLKHHKDRLEERAGRPIRIGGVSARTKAEASQKMKTLLEEHHVKGAPLGMISQESTITHIVRS